MPRQEDRSVRQETLPDEESEQGQLGLFDGLPVTKFKIYFGGNVDLNTYMEVDAAMAKQLTLGKSVQLIVSGQVVSRPQRWKKGGVVHSGATVLVKSIRLQ